MVGIVGALLSGFLMGLIGHTPVTGWELAEFRGGRCRCGRAAVHPGCSSWDWFAGGGEPVGAVSEHTRSLPQPTLRWAAAGYVSGDPTRLVDQGVSRRRVAAAEQ